MNKDTKKARAGKRAFKELKITMTFTAAEWLDLLADFRDMQRYEDEQSNRAYSWDDYVREMRETIMHRVRYGLKYRRGMDEVRRAQANGYNIPDIVIRV